MSQPRRLFGPSATIVQVMTGFFEVNFGSPEDAREYEGTGFDFELIGPGEAWQTVRVKSGLGAGDVSVDIELWDVEPYPLDDELDDWDIAGEVSAVASGSPTVSSITSDIALPPEASLSGRVRVRCCAKDRHGHWDQQAPEGEVWEHYCLRVWPEEEPHPETTIARAAWAVLSESTDVAIR